MEFTVSMEIMVKNNLGKILWMKRIENFSGSITEYYCHFIGLFS